jgi:hypothetical protein
MGISNYSRAGTLLVTFAFGAGLLSDLSGRPAQKDKQMADMPGMDMGGSSKMGPSMMAMAGHMLMTPLRPLQPGDEDKAWAVVAAAKATIERYKDYRKALADGYVIANEKVEQTQYHFNSDANNRAADDHFDPSRPSSLLYFRTPHQRFRLEGVMYTARLHAPEEELNERIPLSIARWHQHTNFCAAPADKVKEYFGAHPKFGMFGSIKTQEACDAEHGHFHPFLFNWMTHVFPYEKDLKDIFSMDDDVEHVH